MKQILSAMIAGAIFGLGIALSGMGNPAKVQNFFDIFGTWDPSLAFVMGGALIVTFIGYRVLFGARSSPLFDTTFHLPTLRAIDFKLIGGSAVFGIGWGISGFCPGGAIPAMGFAPWPTALFLAAMAAGMIIARALKAGLAK
jgi:uncharacterized membrane protein YedE/YeeE